MHETKKADKGGHQREETIGGASKPISLAPLSFDEALEGLLGVRPEPKSKVGTPKKKKVKKD